MKELKDYLKAKDSLDKSFFGFIDYSVDDMTTYSFILTEHDVSWFDEDGAEYSEEIRGFTFDKNRQYLAVCIYACTGDRYIGIFDVSKQLKEEVE
jgi:hypothetical protein